MHRQVAAVAQATVALDFDQPPNVHLNLLAEIAFDAALALDLLAELVDLFFGQVLDLLGVIDLGFFADRPGALLPDAIDRSQTDPEPLLRRQIDTGYACHIPSFCPAAFGGLSLA